MQGFPQKDMAECTKGPWLCWFTGPAAVYFGCLNNDCGFAIKLIDLQPPDQYDMDKMNTMGMLSCCWLTPSHKCKESRWQLGKVFARLGDYNETLPHPRIEHLPDHSSQRRIRVSERHNAASNAGVGDLRRESNCLLSSE